jgi:hypothetical protein
MWMVGFSIQLQSVELIESFSTDLNQSATKRRILIVWTTQLKIFLSNNLF